jgi:hypothetical protein
MSEVLCRSGIRKRPRPEGVSLGRIGTVILAVAEHFKVAAAVAESRARFYCGRTGWLTY